MRLAHEEVEEHQWMNCRSHYHNFNNTVDNKLLLYGFSKDRKKEKKKAIKKN